MAVHALLVGRYPAVAWFLTASSVFAIIWVARDYGALGRGAVDVERDRVRLRVGRRFDIAIPLASIARVLQPTFRDLPSPGTNEGRDFLNLTQPAQPNVLIVTGAPLRVRIGAGLHKNVVRFALHLDAPAEFVSTVAARLPPASGGDAPRPEASS